MSDVNDIIDRLNDLNLEQIRPSTDSASTEEVISLINRSLFVNSNSFNNSNQDNLIFSKSSHLISEQTNQYNDMEQFKPEYLKCIPDFDGNPNDLNRYLSICQNIIDKFYIVNDPNCFQNTFLLNCIIGKLTGNAKLILGTQIVNTWTELKAILGRHFADQRDEACLNRDLVMLRQQNIEKPSDFYNRILHILNLLCSYVDIHETNDAAKILKRKLYNDLALKTFLSGLKEPLGTTIRCMRPTDLPQALQFVTEEYNTQYFQNTPKPINLNPIQRPTTQNFKPTNNQIFSQPFNHQQNTSFFRFPNNPSLNKPIFPSQPIPITPNLNKVPNRFPTNSQVFKKPNVNVFRPNQNQSFPKPTPMSITSRQTINNAPRPNFNGQSNSRNFFQSSNSAPRNFVSEELYNANAYPIPQSNNDTEAWYDAHNSDPNYYNEHFYFEPQNTDLPCNDLSDSLEHLHFEEQGTEPYDQDESENSNFRGTVSQNPKT